MNNRFDRIRSSMVLAASARDTGVPLKVMAASAAMSKHHYHRVFTEIASETPGAFARRLRISRAAALLLSNPDSVFNIALRCGFDSHEGFTRAFRRQFGVTPTAYRARGFSTEVSDEQAEEHRRLIDDVGPCVKLFHIRRDGTRPRNPMTYTITKKTVEPQPVLVERRRVNHSQVSATIGEVVGRLFAHAQKEGLVLTGNPFTRYIDAGPGLMTIEPGMRIAGAPDESESDASDSEEVEVVRRDALPGGDVAVTIHAGSYESLSDGYAAIESWMETEGLTPAGAPWESYLTDPTQYPDPKDWKTEIAWPVK